MGKHQVRVVVRNDALSIPITRGMLEAAMARSNGSSAQAVDEVWKLIIDSLPRTTKRPYRVSTFQSADGWRWRMTAPNGEIVSGGEGHTREADARRAARAMIRSPKLFEIARDFEGAAPGCLPVGGAE